MKTALLAGTLLPGALAGTLLLLCGCVSRQPDHFYVLDAQGGAAHASADISRQVTLQLSLPSTVDRAEWVVTTPAGVAVLEHERWAAPLVDLMTTTLGRDIERRRGDIVVFGSGADQGGIPLVKIAIDVAQLTARLGGTVSIETSWRITDGRSGKVTYGRDVYTSPSPSPGYEGLATALSACVGLLADRLVQDISGA